MAIAVQVRKKVLAALERGDSATSIARRLEVGERSVYRLQARQRAGLPIEPGKPGVKRPTKLTPQDERLLREEVERRPGVTAKQMIPLLSVPVVESTVCRASPGGSGWGCRSKKVAEGRGTEAAGRGAASAQLLDRAAVPGPRIPGVPRRIRGHDAHDQALWPGAGGRAVRRPYAARSLEDADDAERDPLVGGGA